MYTITVNGETVAQFEGRENIKANVLATVAKYPIGQMVIHAPNGRSWIERY